MICHVENNFGLIRKCVSLTPAIWKVNALYDKENP